MKVERAPANLCVVPTQIKRSKKVDFKFLLHRLRVIQSCAVQEQLTSHGGVSFLVNPLAEGQQFNFQLQLHVLILPFTTKLQQCWSYCNLQHVHMHFLMSRLRATGNRIVEHPQHTLCTNSEHCTKPKSLTLSLTWHSEMLYRTSITITGRTCHLRKKHKVKLAQKSFWSIFVGTQ